MGEVKWRFIIYYASPPPTFPHCVSIVRVLPLVGELVFTRCSRKRLVVLGAADACTKPGGMQ